MILEWKNVMVKCQDIAFQDSTDFICSYTSYKELLYATPFNKPVCFHIYLQL